MEYLAHPGLIKLSEARLAVENGEYLEVSGRKGHSFANGQVAAVAREAGAKLWLDSDVHEPKELLPGELADRIEAGAGLNIKEAHALLQKDPQNLLAKPGFGPIPLSHTQGIIPWDSG